MKAWALFAMMLCASVAFAQPAVKPAPPPPARRPAIQHVAAEVADGLGQVPAGALVAVSSVASDIPAPKADELAIRIGTQIAGRIGASRTHPQPVTLAVARAASGRAASLVYVQLEIVKGELRATADLYTVVANGWERLRNPAPGPRAHAFVGASLDAEVRSFLQPIVLEQAQLHKAKHDEVDVLAIGCGDADTDGGLEIVMTTRTRVVVGKLRSGKLVPTKTAAWRDLASRAPVPLREPLGSIVVSPDAHRGEVFVGHTDRGAVLTDAALVARRPLAGLPIPGGSGETCVLANPSAGAFEGPAVACALPTKGAPTALFSMPAERYDAVASLDLVSSTGAVSQVVAARDAATGKLRLRRTDAGGKSQEQPIDGVGAQIALADLDLDGQPEIAISGDGSETDALVVLTWKSTGFQQRLKYLTKEPVRAIAACPPEERGVPAIVAVVGPEIWLVR
jgi:hypothetical protein